MLRTGVFYLSSNILVILSIDRYISIRHSVIGQTNSKLRFDLVGYLAGYPACLENRLYILYPDNLTFLLSL